MKKKNVKRTIVIGIVVLLVFSAMIKSCGSNKDADDSSEKATQNKRVSQNSESGNINESEDVMNPDESESPEPDSSENSAITHSIDERTEEMKKFFIEFNPEWGFTEIKTLVESIDGIEFGDSSRNTWSINYEDENNAGAYVYYEEASQNEYVSSITYTDYYIQEQTGYFARYIHESYVKYYEDLYKEGGGYYVTNGKTEAIHCESAEEAIEMLENYKHE